MQKDKHLIPKLRFSEFEGKWRQKKLKDYTVINPRNEVLPNSFIYIDLESVNNGVLLKEERILKKEAPSRAQRLLQENDILYQTVRPYQKNNYFFNNLAIDYVASTGYAQIRTSQNPRFVYQYLNTHYFVNKVLLRCTGTSYPAINSSDLSQIKVSFPPLEEQQKIANFITAIDTRLQILEKKKALLEQYKKGVMQQIFKQKIRFKNEGGEVFPKWRKYQLLEIADRIKTKNKIDNQNVLTISAQLGLVSQLEYFNKSVSSKNLTGYYLLEKDDFAYNKSYSNGYPMGAFKRLNKYDFGVVSTLYICFRFNEKVSLDFMEQYFETGLQNQEIEKVAQEGARNHGLLNIGVNDFFEIDLKIPCVEEQTKIANFLSAIDKKTTLVNEQIEKTKTYKKGLLQQMFV